MSFFAVCGTLAPYHLLTYAGLFGATAYQSFFAGIVAYKSLPLEMFGRLQHSVFPGYFMIQTVASSLLLATNPFKYTRANSIMLLVSLLTSASNSFVFMPQVETVRAKRDEQMRIEGKLYKDPTASDTMKAINREFAKLHGITVSLNLSGFISLFVYGIFLTAKFKGL